MSKIALILPGLGYNVNRPLLYYSRRIVEKMGYTTAVIQYDDMPQVKSFKDRAVMERCITIGLECAEKQLESIKLDPDDEILVIGKSIGTVIGAKLIEAQFSRARCIWFTPIAESFTRWRMDGIVFHGTNDPWVETEYVRKACAEHKLRLYETAGANHSLETGNVLRDIEEIGRVMKTVSEYLTKDE